MAVAPLEKLWAPFMAIERVQQLLSKATRALDQAAVNYAVVGGNAVAEWVSTVDEDAVRFTKDVDVLVRRQDFASLAQALQQAGLMRGEVLGVIFFAEPADPSPRRAVHIVFANERIRAHYRHPAPDPELFVRLKAGYRVLELPALVAMKLQSFRDIDRAHIRDLLSLGMIDSVVEERLPLDLLERLNEIRSSPED